MEIYKDFDGDNLTVKLKGRLDAVTAIELDKDVAKILDGVKTLTFDLEKLDYIASAGLRILLKLQKKMNLQGEMKIINVNHNVREVLDMTGFSRLLTIEEPTSRKGFSLGF